MNYFAWRILNILCNNASFVKDGIKILSSFKKMIHF